MTQMFNVGFISLTCTDAQSHKVMTLAVTVISEFERKVVGVVCKFTA